MFIFTFYSMGFVCLSQIVKCFVVEMFVCVNLLMLGLSMIEESTLSLQKEDCFKLNMLLRPLK